MSEDDPVQGHIFLEGTKTRMGPSEPPSPALAKQHVPHTFTSALGVLEIADSKSVDPSKNTRKMCFFKDYREM